MCAPTLAVLSFFATLLVACSHRSLNVTQARDGGVGGSGGDIVGAGGDVIGASGAGGNVTGTGGDSRDARDNPDAAGIRADSSIVGRCAVDSECLPVLDYRAGFECYSPVAASVSDLAHDPCLVRWNPKNPKCPLATPPDDCPGGPIAVNHSCLIYCRFAVCNDGTCTLQADFSTPNRCNASDSGPPSDCQALRAAYFAALAAAQSCDPAKTPTTCFDAFYDSCGCPAAADMASRKMAALQCALGDLQQASCGFGNCGTPCPAKSAPACVTVPTPDGPATTGTCVVH